MSARIAIAGALLVAALAGCQDSNVSREVGARCDTSSECDGSCLGPSNDYPGGFCTVQCDIADTCPGQSTCADLNGGACLFTCNDANDCKFLGEAWTCTFVNQRGAAAKVKVCRGS